MSGNKYRAKKCEADGFQFDSQAERARYFDLKLLLRAGEISDLKIHPSYELKIDGIKIGSFKPDFRYLDKTGKIIVEDVKGVVSQAASLRIRVFEACYGLSVTIIGKNVAKVRRFKTKAAA